jgi:hypothetical protein
MNIPPLKAIFRTDSEPLLGTGVGEQLQGGGGGGGGGGVDGVLEPAGKLITCPAKIKLGFWICGFTASKELNEHPIRTAILASVSPTWTV